MRAFLGLLVVLLVLAKGSGGLAQQGEGPAAAVPQDTPPQASPGPAAQVPAQGPAPGTGAEDAAQAPPAEPTEEQRAQARDAYTLGQSLFAQKNYVDARAAFQRAFEAVPNPVVLLSIAESELKLSRPGPALALFKRYLELAPAASDRSGVEARIQELEALPTYLVITSEPPGAAIRVDGQDVAKVTPAEVEVSAGAHTVQLTLPEWEDAQEQVQVELGTRFELSLALRRPPPPPAPEPEVAVSTTPEVELEATPVPEPSTAALWITGVVGAAGLVGGTVLGFMALAESSDFDADPTAASADRGERLALFADVAFGVGAMALITGIVLYVTDGEPVGGESDQTAGLQLMPGVAPDGASLTTRLSF